MNMFLWYYASMRTTIDIPDTLYRQAKIEAFERGTSLRALMINSLRREIEGGREPAVEPALLREERAVYDTDELGFVVLKRGDRKQVVNDSFINAMRDKEGI